MSRRRPPSPAGRHISAILAVLGIGALAGCLSDDPVQPAAETAGGLFRSYVAMGGSITAGFRSGGLTASFQNEAYPAVAAARIGAYFEVPALRDPGCPPPLRDALSGVRVDSTVSCALRRRPPPLVIHNVAVPSAHAADALDNLRLGGTANFLTTLILGGRTQVQAMADADPSLVSFWFGTHEVLNAILLGDFAFATPVATFAADIDSIAEIIALEQPVDVVVLGGYPPEAYGLVQPGAFYWALQETGFQSRIDPDCAPGSTGADNRVSSFALGDPALTTISCADDAPWVLSSAEQDSLRLHLDAFQDILRQTADRHGWLFLDVDSAFAARLQDPDAFRSCQGFASAVTMQDFIAAFENTCPHPSAAQLYGSFVSFDGLYPSAAFHDQLADALLDLLETRHPLPARSTP